jgi:hypothetical protein
MRKADVESGSSIEEEDGGSNDGEPVTNFAEIETAAAAGHDTMTAHTLHYQTKSSKKYFESDRWKLAYDSLNDKQRERWSAFRESSIPVKKV